MPGGNGTGPTGFGPMTGRAAGFCAGFGRPGFMTPGPGKGMGFGFRGGGRRRRGAWCAPWAAPGAAWQSWGPQAAGFAGPTRQQEREMLQDQIQHMENTLSELRQRLTELEAEKQQGSQE